MGSLKSFNREEQKVFCAGAAGNALPGALKACQLSTSLPSTVHSRTGVSLPDNRAQSCQRFLWGGHFVEGWVRLNSSGSFPSESSHVGIPAIGPPGLPWGTSNIHESAVWQQFVCCNFGWGSETCPRLVPRPRHTDIDLLEWHSESASKESQSGPSTCPVSTQWGRT